MKTYKIEHHEELVDYFYIQANSATEALEKFDIEVANGRIDFSKLEMVSSCNTAEEVPDCSDR